MPALKPATIGQKFLTDCGQNRPLTTPKPPFNWNHEYLFTLYTLDCTLEADEKSRKEDILKLAEDHILQKGELRGKYQRKHR